MVSPVIAGIAALGGYIVYEHVNQARASADQPPPEPQQPFYSSWFNNGNQPQTGNGTPKTDVGSIANAVGDLAKFGTSLAGYFGTAKSSGSSGNGIGASSTQTQSYGSGAPLGDADGNFSEPADWSMPSFDS